MKKNEQIIWSKVVLLSYRYLEKLCSTIDRLVETTAENSMFTNSYWQSECSITNIYNKIKRLTNKKIDYINLKITVEKALKNLPLKSSKILILKYIHQLTNEEIANILKMSDRTLYRKVEMANEQFFKQLSSLGYSLEYLNITFSDDAFISSMLNSVQNYKDRCAQFESISKDSLFSKFLCDFKFSIV